ncbi:hypothetical protein HPB48_021316 [Haemaphysalis longicornis]|uniref:Uncharacterized protein n=1 Tax=Haemaphysalis longicornis TaxID=44386 RepID=A0A9J6GS97_HAELO|nr:hypothetical protein HPB48_021316 [Haemaphysalis longicornis]
MLGLAQTGKAFQKLSTKLIYVPLHTVIFSKRRKINAHAEGPEHMPVPFDLKEATRHGTLTLTDESASHELQSVDVVPSVSATGVVLAPPTSAPLTSEEVERLRQLHDQSMQGRASSLTVALIIACISSIALALIKITIKRHDNISSAECVFFVGTGILVSVMPSLSNTAQPFGPASAQKRLGVSAILTTLAYILGYMAVQFMSVVEATVVAAITPMTTWFTSVAVRRRPCHWVLVPALAACVTAIVLVIKPPMLGFKVRATASS